MLLVHLSSTNNKYLIYFSKRLDNKPITRYDNTLFSLTLFGKDIRGLLYPLRQSWEWYFTDIYERNTHFISHFITTHVKPSFCPAWIHIRLVDFSKEIINVIIKYEWIGLCDELIESLENKHFYLLPNNIDIKTLMRCENSAFLYKIIPFLGKYSDFYTQLEKVADLQFVESYGINIIDKADIIYYGLVSNKNKGIIQYFMKKSKFIPDLLYQLHAFCDIKNSPMFKYLIDIKLITDPFMLSRYHIYRYQGEKILNYMQIKRYEFNDMRLDHDGEADPPYSYFLRDQEQYMNRWRD